MAEFRQFFSDGANVDVYIAVDYKALSFRDPIEQLVAGKNSPRASSECLQQSEFRQAQV